MSLAVRNVTRSFDDPPTRVLDDISFEVESGEFVALTGKSGSGKSTLLYIMGSLDFPTSGEVLIHNRSLTAMDQKELHTFRNLHMGFVFQFHYLLPELTVFENVILPARKRGEHEKPSRKELAVSLLEEFGLQKKFDSLPAKLSGGERQRVALARALVMEPDFLFADEPTGSLDSKNGEIVLSIFDRINRTLGTTIIMVTHDRDYASMAQKRIVLVDGRVEEIT